MRVVTRYHACSVMAEMGPTTLSYLLVEQTLDQLL